MQDQHVLKYDNLEKDFFSDIRGNCAFICERLDEYYENQLSIEQLNYLSALLPRIVLKITKECPATEHTSSLVSLFRHIIDFVFSYGLTHHIPSLVEILPNLFEPFAPLHIKSFRLLEADRTHLDYTIQQNSGLLLWEDMVNYLEKKHYFDAIYDYLKSPHATLHCISYLVSLLHSLRSHLTPQFVDRLTKELQHSVEQRFKSLNEAEIKSLPRDELNKVINNILEKTAVYSEKVFSSHVVRSFIAECGWKVAMACFNTQIPDKVSYALSFFNNMATFSRFVGVAANVTGSSSGDLLYTYISNKDGLIDEETLVKWITDSKILPTVLNPKNHDHLKKSTQIVELMARFNKLSSSDIQALVEASTKSPPSVGIKFVELLSNICTSLQNHHLETLCAHFETLKIANLESELVSNIIIFYEKVFRSIKETTKYKFLSLLWKIIEDENQKIEYCAKVMKSLTGLVITADFARVKESWIEESISAISKKNNTLSSFYELLINIINTYSSFRKIQQMQTMHREGYLTRVDRLISANYVEQVVMYLETAHNLLEFVFEEYFSFVEKARKLAKQNPSGDPDLCCLGGRGTYQSEISQRISMMEVIMKNLSGHSILNNESVWNVTLYRLWDTSAVNPLSKQERTSCLQLFINLRDLNQSYGKEEYLSIDLRAAHHIFKTRICKYPPGKMDMLAYKCFQLYFCYSNIYKQNLEWMISPTNTLPFGTFQVTDRNLYGSQSVWNVIFEAKDEKVVESSTKFLYQLTEMINNHLKQSVGVYNCRDRFLQTLFDKLENARKLYESPQEPTSKAQNKLVIDRCLAILLSFLSNDPSINPWTFYDNFKPVLIQVINNITKEDVHGTAQFLLGEDVVIKYEEVGRWLSPPFGPDKFIVKTHSNITFGQLRRLIWESMTNTTEFKNSKCSIPEEDIILQRIRDGELDSDREAKSKAILTKTLLQLGYLSNETLRVSVIPNINGRQTSLKSKHKDNSTQKSSMITNAKASSYEEKLARLQSEYPIHRELAVHLLTKNQNNYESAVMELRDTYPEVIPSASSAANANPSPAKEAVDRTSIGWIISQSRTYFDALFDVLKVPEISTQFKVWELLQKIPRSQSLIDTIFPFQSTPSWNTLLGQDLYRKLYILQMMNSKIFTSPIIEHLRWWKGFLNSNGTETVLQNLISISDSFPSPSPQLVQTITFLLKLLAFSINIKTPQLNEQLTMVTDLRIVQELRASFPTAPFDAKQADLIVQMIVKIMKWISELPEIEYFSITTRKKPSNKKKKGKEVIPPSDPEGIWVGTVVNYAFNILLHLSHQFTDTPTKILADPQFMQLVFSLLRNDERLVRDETATGFYNLASLLSPENYNITIKNVLNKQPGVLDNTLSSKSREFYTLLRNLINGLAKVDITEYGKVFSDTWKDIQGRSAIEVGKQVDWILAGKLSILEILLKKDPNFSSQFPAEWMKDEKIIDLFMMEYLFMVTDRITLPKCRSLPSRYYALSILEQVCKKSTACYEKVVKYLTFMHTGRLKLVHEWDFNPGSNLKKGNGLVGISNPGGVCHMNSLIQQLLRVPDFKKGIFSIYSIFSSESFMLYSLQQIFGYLVVSEKRWIESSIFSKSFKVEGKANDVDVQHDIDEYLDYLFRHLFSNLRGSSNPSLLNICFGVTLTNEIKSATKDVPYLSEKEEVFFKIPTDISTGSLKESLNSLMSPDQLEGESGMWSEEADKRINCTRRYRLTDLSNCIIFSLKRFEYVSGNRKKVNSKFSFPLSLNMKEWVEDSSRPGDYYEYELSGIIVHAGNSETGHYYSFIKQADDSGKMHWYRFDDVSVEPWNVKNIERDCFGGTEENKNACVLFYQRKQPSEVFWDETENIEGIPKRLYQEVQRENMALFQDRQYFNYTYSEFMLQMSWKLPTALVNYKRPNNSRNDPFTHFQILTRYLLEILIHSGEKSLFSRFVPVMRSIFNGNSDCARYFLLFTLKASGSEIHSTYPHDCNILKKVLLECKEEHLRISFVDLVVAALAVLSPREWKEKVWGKPKILKDETIYGTSLNPGDEMEGFSVCCQVMQSLFTMIDASRSVWPQFKQYFEIIRDFAMMDFYHRDYLREQFVIRELHDYFMNSRSGRPRAPIMDSDYFPDLRNFQEILEVILRGAKTERFPPNIEDDDFYRTPWSMPSRLNAQLHPHELSHLYDTKLFFHMIEMDYNYESMSRVVRHVCWNCEERSTKVVLTLVENIKSQVTEYKMMHIVPTKLNALLKTLHAVLSLNDTLKSQRIHWTLSPHKIHYESHHGITDTTGLLGVLRSEDKQVTQLMSFILYLALQNKTDLISEPMHSVYSYLIHRRSEVYWMKDYLTSKIEASNEQLPKGISEKDYEVAVKELLDTPFINYPITPNALFAIVSKLCEESSMLDDIPPFWKTQEITYLKQIEELKARIEREKAAIAELQESLANAQKNSRATYPDIPPPDENGVWKNGTKTATQQNQTVAGHRRATSDPIPETVVAESQAIVVAGPSPRVPPRPNHPIPVPMGTNPANPPVYGPHRPNSPVNSPAPSTSSEDPAEPNNAKSLIQKMKEIFYDYDEGLLKIALKAANWDTERAVDNMFDSNRVAEYQRQAHLGS